MHNFIVIDQNFLQLEELRHILSSSEDGQCFVITDTAMMEIMKNGAETYEWSLKIISDYSGKIYVSLSPSEIPKNELITKVPCKNIISSERTDEFRKILHEIRAGIYGTARAKADTDIPVAIQSVAENQLNHKKNKTVLMNMYKAISDDLGLDCCKGLRKGLINKKLQYEYIIKQVVKSMKTTLSDNGFTNKEMDAFIKKDSFLYRQKALFGWRCINWVAECGLENLLEKKATNELMDLDYIIIATYGQGILSKEKSFNKKPAMKWYEEMQDIINLHINGG